jgi:protein-disulfide isomerase
MQSNKWCKAGLIVTAIALILSIYATVGSYKANKVLNDEAGFNTKVEAGIQAFIKKQQAAQGQGEEAAAPTGPVDVSIDNNAVRGNKDAKVTIVEFSDFECPFCGKYFRETFPQVKSDYIDTGKVAYVFRHFPLSFHQNARPAALASECVKALGSDEVFWKYHDTLYANQTSLTTENLKKFASDLGLDIGTCLDTAKYASEVDKDFQDGQKYGVKGTPAFFINGTLLSGAQPFSAFQAAIDAELAK